MQTFIKREYLSEEVPDISIIIPVKNGGNSLQEVLLAIFNQKTDFSYEVIVIDSGSIDTTLEIVKKFPVRVAEIKPEEFGHGRTRNLGARMAKGKYLVYLTQDAIPANEYWLQNLVKNLEEDGDVAGVYSRWLPKPNCNPIEARLISELFKPIKEIRKLKNVGQKDYLKNLKQFISFSNVSSCLRKSIWEEIPFDNESIYGEDQKWAKRVLEAGYTIIYEPHSLVYHSHNDSLKMRFKRKFDEGISIRKRSKNEGRIFFIPFLAFYRAYKVCNFIQEEKTVQRIGWIFYSIIVSIIEDAGLWLGIHSKWILKALRRRFSTVPHMIK